ncbi:ferrous iron transport protein B [uncultured Fretibacterium sp.]|uniref:ferrous iron transport protein B n=1 Tax=uncultured Fretibacterium sp. TaxID=1678694 RepID=UPI002635C386|nr:ferrous iron transport protein B [uncultured Fretibacterium sp.]
MGKKIVALAGQPNCGKSTVFNSLTGAKQFVANYPGVTVDKMMGWYKRDGETVEVVDLPGTYSLTSYSPEERVSRDVLLKEPLSAVVNVVDAANLKRSLYLTLQLLEMEIPLVLDLNMMDVAEGLDISVDVPALSRELGVPVVATAITHGRGREDLFGAISDMSRSNARTSVAVSELYPDLQDALKELEALLADSSSSGGASLQGTFPLPWIAVKLMEGDPEVAALVRERAGDDGAARDILSRAEALREAFEHERGMSADLYVSGQRSRRAAAIAKRCVSRKNTEKVHVSERIDRLVCNRFFGPVFLLFVIYGFYYLSFIQGYNLTHYTWPVLAGFRSLAESVLPQPGIIELPLLREFVLWVVDNLNALLNYIPIFFILFALIAVLEDSGYMPRIAFVLDRILSRFGLHGQSTLPMILGGVVLGGCSVPAVMATKGIPDEKSKLATILTLPMLNCQAKLPLYFLLIGIYFNETVRLPLLGEVNQQSIVIVFIQTISLLFVLPLAKILSMTVLRHKETAPFIMEMPPYHIPSVRGVLGRAIERIWLYIRKITTVVAAVAVVLFVLLQFPGLTPERRAHYEAEKDRAVRAFLGKAEGKRLGAGLRTEKDVLDMILFQQGYRDLLKSGASAEAKKAYGARNPDFFEIVQNKKDPEAKELERELKKLLAFRTNALTAIRRERIDNSLLGKIGRALEPASRYAGFNWRVNVAVLSTLAAKENSVSTLGALYIKEPGENEGAGGEKNTDTLEQRMKRQEGDLTPLHAMALMLFMVLCPPCLPTIMAIRVQTGSTGWMLFAFFVPLILGLLAAVLVFTGGSALGLSGFEAMWMFYLIPLTLTILLGLIRTKRTYS